ncbi:MAG: GNAT family N-acetyltransferase, partial [Candidatus Omnitrophica bacterium]|nr:GNAT family N-acetyltransferase [Candidatus Omnitrophota bacterium]
LGFKKISKSKLPHKIWAECCNCPKFPGCEEEAVIKNI